MINPRYVIGAVGSAANKVAPVLSVAYAGYQVYNIVKPLVSTYINSRRSSNVNSGLHEDEDEDDGVVELIVAPRRKLPKHLTNNRTNYSRNSTEAEQDQQVIQAGNVMQANDGDAQQGFRPTINDVVIIDEVGIDCVKTITRTNNHTQDDEVEIVQEIPGTREIDAMFQERLRQDQELPIAGPSNYVPSSMPGKRIVFLDEELESDEDNHQATTTTDSRNKKYPKSPPTESRGSTSSPVHTGEGGLDLDSDMLCQICGRYLHHADKELSALPFCDHLFHEKCIQSVMAFNRKCPKCLSSVFSPI